jgi:glutamine cyclotransferase
VALDHFRADKSGYVTTIRPVTSSANGLIEVKSEGPASRHYALAHSKRLLYVVAISAAVVLGVATLVLSGASAHAKVSAPVESYKIVHEYPHDHEAFTQGLIYLDRSLYESTGLEGHSSIRRVDLETGRVLQKREIPRPYFAEGLTSWRGQLIQLTWLSNVGFVYDLLTLNPKDQFHYAWQGWGLTHDRKQLIASDGSDTLRFLDPATYSVTRELRVKDGGKPIENLNELEYVAKEIYANVWQTELIARISPSTGNVLSWIDLTGLLRPSDSNGSEVDVLNGIAYDDATDRLFVTGKLWPKLFEIKVVDRPSSNPPSVR